MVIVLVQENHTIGFWKGKSGRERSFCRLTNFGLRLLKHVRAPTELPRVLLWKYRSYNVHVQQEVQTLQDIRSSEGKFELLNYTMHGVIFLSIVSIKSVSCACLLAYREAFSYQSKTVTNCCNILVLLYQAELCLVSSQFHRLSHS